jgi:hypothetical protein
LLRIAALETLDGIFFEKGRHVADVLRTKRWYGPEPRPGEFLRAAWRTRGKRPIFAFRILGIEATAKKTGYAFTVAKVPLKELPQGAVVHGWNWNACAGTHRDIMARDDAAAD